MKIAGPIAALYQALLDGTISRRDFIDRTAATGAGIAQQNDGDRRNAENQPSIVDRLLDSPRVVVPGPMTRPMSRPTTGVGTTGYISQKKKNPAPKKKLSPTAYEAQPEEPFVARKSRLPARPKQVAAPVLDPKLAARNPSLRRVQSADTSDITGSTTPLRVRRVQAEDEPFGPVGVAGPIGGEHQQIAEDLSDSDDGEREPPDPQATGGGEADPQADGGELQGDVRDDPRDGDPARSADPPPPQARRAEPHRREQQHRGDDRENGDHVRRILRS